jgi:hypothetical protein
MSVDPTGVNGTTRVMFWLGYVWAAARAECVTAAVKPPLDEDLTAGEVGYEQVCRIGGSSFKVPP